MTDAQWMAQAIQLARKGQFSVHPNPLVGCVLVKNNRRIGAGWHQRAGQAHAEVEALRSASESVEGAIAYVTLEPCAHQGRTGPCVEALLEARVSAVVIGMTDPNPLVAGKGIHRLRQAGIEVRTPVLEAECRALNPGFLSLFERRRPYVVLKSAMSLDGRTALSNGRSQWITSDAARADVQRHRALASCVLSTARTVLMDNARLTDRTFPPERHGRALVRVIIDRQLLLTPELNLFNDQSPLWILTVSDDQPKREALEHAGARVHRLVDGQLSSVMQFLTHERLGLVWVEAGATLSGQLLQEQWVDEWVVYLATTVLGDLGMPLVRLPSALTELSQRLLFKQKSLRQVGQDLRLVLTPTRA